MNLPVDAI